MQQAAIGLSHIAAESAAFGVARWSSPIGNAVVVIGCDCWQRLLGGTADVIGRTLQIGRATYDFIGVAPQGLRAPSRGVTPAVFAAAHADRTAHGR